MLLPAAGACCQLGAFSQAHQACAANPRQARSIYADLMWLQEDMNNAKLEIGYRDFCAHLLIPLNECRRKEMYLPWKCEHERHAYEKCEYLEYKRRVKKQALLRNQ